MAQQSLVHSTEPSGEAVQRAAVGGPFYIASLKHTHKDHHEHITFWGPDCRGYRLAFTDGNVGLYTAEFIAKDCYHLSDGVGCLAVPESVVKGLLSARPYYRNSRGVAAPFYDTPGPVVENTRANWNALIKAAALLPAGVKPKPEVFRGTRRSFALTEAEQVAA